jgi:hypothetical protein
MCTQEEVQKLRSAKNRAMERWQKEYATGRNDKQARSAFTLVFDAWLRAIESTEQVAESMPIEAKKCA